MEMNFISTRVISSCYWILVDYRCFGLFEVSILFPWGAWLFLWKFQDAQIIIGMHYILKSSIVMSIAFNLMFEIALAIWYLLCFHMNVFIFSRSEKDECWRYFNCETLKLCIDFRSMNILITIRKHKIIFIFDVIHFSFLIFIVVIPQILGSFYSKVFVFQLFKGIDFVSSFSVIKFFV